MSDARQQILTTAAELFEQRGYELVGINEIIEKSSVAKATFYAHFKSKEKLCAEWLRVSAIESETANRAMLRDNVSALEKLARKFDSLKRYVTSSNFRGCPFSITASMLESSSEVREIIRDYKASSRGFWQSLALEVRPDPTQARALGDAWFLLFSGAVTEAQNARNTWPVDAAKESAIALANI
jgi:AcrR family transcriptional regulator